MVETILAADRVVGGGGHRVGNLYSVVVDPLPVENAERTI
jgi:hypothetical protein